MRMMVDCPTPPCQDNSSVFPRECLDPKHAKQFKKEWLFDSDETGVLQFDSEDEACLAQRNYRKANGFDPITGERVIS